MNTLIAHITAGVAVTLMALAAPSEDARADAEQFALEPTVACTVVTRDVRYQWPYYCHRTLLLLPENRILHDTMTKVSRVRNSVSGDGAIAASHL